MSRQSRLTRPRRGSGAVIAGVCGAIAGRFGLSVSLVRLAFVVFGLVGAGEVVYLLLWILIPKEGRAELPDATTDRNGVDSGT